MEQYRSRKEQKRAEAEERQTTRNKRTHQQQLDHLDEKFGKDVGSQKERARLQTFIDSGEKKYEPEEPVKEKHKKSRKSKKSKINEKYS